MLGDVVQGHFRGRRQHLRQGPVERREGDRDVIRGGNYFGAAATGLVVVVCVFPRPPSSGGLVDPPPGNVQDVAGPKNRFHGEVPPQHAVGNGHAVLPHLLVWVRVGYGHLPINPPRLLAVHLHDEDVAIVGVRMDRLTRRGGEVGVGVRDGEGPLQILAERGRAGAEPIAVVQDDGTPVEVGREERLGGFAPLRPPAVERGDLRYFEGRLLRVEDHGQRFVPVRGEVRGSERLAALSQCADETGDAHVDLIGVGIAVRIVRVRPSVDARSFLPDVVHELVVVGRAPAHHGQQRGGDPSPACIVDAAVVDPERVHRLGRRE
mmetsp:Transcript_20852/g.60700  ORF Transcript_20852/g.60700 Transcript_20852/m.60700 type:complete len:321 (+) Transcript_20852:880-1842(+)